MREILYTFMFLCCGIETYLEVCVKHVVLSYKRLSAARVRGFFERGGLEVLVCVRDGRDVYELGHSHRRRFWDEVVASSKLGYETYRCILVVSSCNNNVKKWLSIHSLL
jgi:hypothetical protein